MKITYAIEGMHCTSCIEKIRLALSAHVQILELTLNPPLLKVEANTLPNQEILNNFLSNVGRYRLKIIRSEASSVHPSEIHLDSENREKGLRAYYPLFLIITYIIGVAFINNWQQNEINWYQWMHQFMAGFFLIFSAFKLLNLEGFAEGYASYDLLAKRWYTYGFVYPFLELGLGVLYLGEWFPQMTLVATIIIMGFSSLGVIVSLAKKQKIRCACLGNILNVPLSSITLIEDLAMVVMAVMMLIAF